MEITKSNITTADEYLDFVRKFATLLDEQLCRYEKDTLGENELQELASHLPTLISLVNTVGCLRGQDGMFLDIRPKTDNQQELNDLEVGFENRLQKCIDIIMNSNQREFYLSKLSTYFVQARS
jgi:hypothetical protein